MMESVIALKRMESSLIVDVDYDKRSLYLTSRSAAGTYRKFRLTALSGKIIVDQVFELPGKCNRKDYEN